MKLIVACLLIILAQIQLSRLISYPPTSEQLPLILSFPGNHLVIFWGLRLLSLLVICLALSIFHRLTDSYFGRKVADFSTLIVLLSPTTFAVWNLHPLDAAGALVVMAASWAILNRKGGNLLWGMIGLSLVLLLLSQNQPLTNIPITNALQLSGAVEEITSRLDAEETLPQKVNIPLTIKRIADNKVFYVYKNVLSAILKFGDVETIFFQEVHPLGLKSFVIFYWPEVLLFAVGFIWAVQKTNKPQQKFLIFFLVISFVDFLLLNKTPYRQFFLTLFTLSLFVAQGAKVLAKIPILPLAMSGLLVLATLINFSDLAVRTSYWFDNRPLVYQFIFRELSTWPESALPKVQVSSLVGDAALYCRYWLDSCPGATFSFNSFNFRADRPQKGTLYAGFIGEFFGPEFTNTFPNNWKDELKGQGFRLIGFYTAQDEIAEHYGQTVILATFR